MNRLSNIDKNIPILIVDDFSTVRRVVKNCLSRLGFKNVIEASDGLSALEIMRSNPVKLIISDWEIPHIHDSNLLNTAHNDTANKDKELKCLPVLVIIPESKNAQIQKESTPENKQYLVKPFTTDVLEAKMEALLEKQDG
jgi:two-component system, chemotaxis family, chemotaxis protein CheY